MRTINKWMICWIVVGWFGITGLAWSEDDPLAGAYTGTCDWVGTSNQMNAAECLVGRADTNGIRWVEWILEQREKHMAFRGAMQRSADGVTWSAAPVAEGAKPPRYQTAMKITEDGWLMATLWQRGSSPDRPVATVHVRRTDNGRYQIYRGGYAWQEGPNRYSSGMKCTLGPVHAGGFRIMKWDAAHKGNRQVQFGRVTQDADGRWVRTAIGDKPNFEFSSAFTLGADGALSGTFWRVTKGPEHLAGKYNLKLSDE